MCVKQCFKYSTCWQVFPKIPQNTPKPTDSRTYTYCTNRHTHVHLLYQQTHAHTPTVPTDTHTHTHLQYQHGSEDVFSATHTPLNDHIRILQAAVCIYDPLHIVHTCTQLLVNLEVRICSLQLKEYYRSNMKPTEGQDGEEVAGKAG